MGFLCISCGYYQPYIPKILRSNQCDIIIRQDRLNNSLPKGKIICVQKTEEALFRILKDIGGYNPNYVAMNATEAAKFRDPRLFGKLPKATPTPTTPLPTTKRPTTKRPRTTFRPPYWMKTPTPDYYGWWFYKRSKVGLEDSDQSNPVLTRSKRVTEKKMECWNRADVVKNSKPERKHMCGECHVVTRLDKNIRPKFLNEAVCMHNMQSTPGSPKCAWDSGLCVQRVLKLPTVRLTGRYETNPILTGRFGRTILSEIIEPTTDLQNIRSSCQCQIYSTKEKALKRKTAGSS